MKLRTNKIDQFDTTSRNGKLYALVPLDQLKKLIEEIEMAMDIKAYDKAKRETREFFPSNVVDAILQGKNPLQIYRKYRKMTQIELAKKSGIGRTLIAEIETGKKNGSIKTIKQLAKALGLTADMLI